MIDRINIKYEVIIINIGTNTSDLNDNIYICILNYNYIIRQRKKKEKKNIQQIKYKKYMNRKKRNKVYLIEKYKKK